MKRYLLWIVELFVWLLILFLVSGSILFAKFSYRRSFDTYQIFLPDVDGLIKGSPVRLMGIQIGYVNQIDIVGEDVYVKFIVTNSKLRLPKNTIATVEGTGLGGSKSLELYPPSAKKIPTDKFIVPQAPKRIHDSLGLLNDMYDQVVGITYDVSHFMNQVGIIKNNDVIEQQKSANKIIQDSNDWLDRAQKQTDKLSNGLKNKKERINGKNSATGETKHE